MSLQVDLYLSDELFPGSNEFQLIAFFPVTVYSDNPFATEESQNISRFNVNDNFRIKIQSDRNREVTAVLAFFLNFYRFSPLDSYWN